VRRTCTIYEQKLRRCVLRRLPAPKVGPQWQSWTPSSRVAGCARARRCALTALLTRWCDAGHADSQTQALRQAEERWGLSFREGEPVVVPGHDWEWQIESQVSSGHSLAATAPPPVCRAGAENLGLVVSLRLPLPPTETELASLSPTHSMMTPVCPGAPCKKRVRFAAEDPETVVSMDIVQKIKDAFNRIAEREPTKDDWLDLISEVNKQIYVLESPATSKESAPPVKDADPAPGRVGGGGGGEA